MTDDDRSTWSEKKLLQAAKEGDELAGEELVRRNNPWMKREAEDRAQREGRPVWSPFLFWAAQDALRVPADDEQRVNPFEKYDASRGASFETFAKSVARNRFNNEIRKLKRLVRGDPEDKSNRQSISSSDAFGIVCDTAIDGIPDPVVRVRWLVVAIVRYGCTAKKLSWPEIAHVLALREHPLALVLVRIWPDIRSLYRLDLLDDPPDLFPPTWEAAVEAVFHRPSKEGTASPHPPLSTSSTHLNEYGGRLQVWFDRIKRKIAQNPDLDL